MKKSILYTIVFAIGFTTINRSTKSKYSLELDAHA